MSPTISSALAGTMQPPSCTECWMLPLFKRQKQWDGSEMELVIHRIKIATFKCPVLPLFIMPAKTETSPPWDDDDISLVSASLASYGSKVLISVSSDFPLAMEMEIF